MHRALPLTTTMSHSGNTTETSARWYRLAAASLHMCLMLSSQVHSVKLSRPVQWMSARGRVWGFQLGSKVELHQVSIGSDLGTPIYTLDLAPNSPAQCAWGWAPQVSLENSGVVVSGAHGEIQLVGKQPNSGWGVASQVKLRKGESSPGYVCCNRVCICNVLMCWGVVVAWHGAMMAQ